jgi:hypothetical protein
MNRSSEFWLVARVAPTPRLDRYNRPHSDRSVRFSPRKIESFRNSYATGEVKCPIIIDRGPGDFARSMGTVAARVAWDLRKCENEPNIECMLGCVRLLTQSCASIRDPSSGTTSNRIAKTNPISSVRVDAGWPLELAFYDSAPDARCFGFQKTTKRTQFRVYGWVDLAVMRGG